MKHAIIIARPAPESFTVSLGTAYANAVRTAGQEAILRDLYRMKFAPCLRVGEIPGPGGFEAAADIEVERARIADVDVFVLVYPFWFNAPPAMMVGYIDRVLGPGFGFAPGAWGSEPLLKGRKLLSITVSGAPTAWVEKTGAMEAHDCIFACHVAAVCGMDVVDRLHFGGIAPGISSDAGERAATEVRSLFSRHFAPVTEGNRNASN